MKIKSERKRNDSEKSMGGIRSVAFALFFVVAFAASGYAASWSGYVVDNASQPVGNANVTAVYNSTGEYINSTLTNASGFFNVSGLPNNITRLNVSAIGFYSYQSQALPNISDDRWLPFNITLQMMPGNGSLNGTVKDWFGNAVIARISLIGTDYGATSDNNGNYIIDNIPAGMYSLSISSCYPSQNITNVWIAANTTATQDWRLGSADTVFRLSGTIGNGAGAKVELKQNGEVKYSTTATSGGSYWIDVAPGNYEVVASRDGYYSNSTTITLPDATTCNKTWSPTLREIPKTTESTTPTGKITEYRHTLAGVVADLQYGMKVISDSAVTEIDIIFGKNLTSVVFKVKKLEQLANITPLQNVYQYINITADGASDADIKNASISFKVAKAWLEGKSGNLTLARYKNGWNNLPTIKVDEDSNYMYYRSQTPGFSIFAVYLIESISPCIENWNCSAWSPCVNGTQSRKCVDLNACNTTMQKPAETQICACTENWNCTEWSACINGSQSRNCTDLAGCGTNVSMPALTQSCIVEEPMWFKVLVIGILIAVIAGILIMIAHRKALRKIHKRKRK